MSRRQDLGRFEEEEQLAAALEASEEVRKAQETNMMVAKAQATMRQAFVEDEQQITLTELREKRTKDEGKASCTACGGGQPGPDNELLLCDNLHCQTIAWHQLCLDPPVGEIPDGLWHCPFCTDMVAANNAAPVVDDRIPEAPDAAAPADAVAPADAAAPANAAAPADAATPADPAVPVDAAAPADAAAQGGAAAQGDAATLGDAAVPADAAAQAVASRAHLAEATRVADRAREAAVAKRAEASAAAVAEKAAIKEAEEAEAKAKQAADKAEKAAACAVEAEAQADRAAMALDAALAAERQTTGTSSDPLPPPLPPPPLPSINHNDHASRSSLVVGSAIETLVDAGISLQGSATQQSAASQSATQQPAAQTASGKRKVRESQPMARPARRGKTALEWSGAWPKGTKVEVLFDAGEKHEKWYTGSVEKYEMYWDTMQYCIVFTDGDKHWYKREVLEVLVAAAEGVRFL